MKTPCINRLLKVKSHKWINIFVFELKKAAKCFAPAAFLRKGKKDEKTNILLV